MNKFIKIKENKLSSPDLSKKGSVDDAIKDLVEFINKKSQFVTTSSCSGRIIVVSHEGSNRKQGCKWIFASHTTVNAEELKNAVITQPENSTFKFEPFILHVLCQSLEDAQRVHVIALEAGFKNSGITVSKKGNVMLAVRSTHGLEVPLADGNELMVSEEYLTFLVRKANESLIENNRRTKKFYELLQVTFQEAG